MEGTQNSLKNAAMLSLSSSVPFFFKYKLLDNIYPTFFKASGQSRNFSPLNKIIDLKSEYICVLYNKIMIVDSSGCHKRR